MNYWLMKSEPDEFSIDQLKKDKKTFWTGVRNYQARNFMMNDMKKGDLILFYHSNAEPSGVAGLATVTGQIIADPLQFDKKSDYYDPKAKVEKPIWFSAEIQYKEHFKNFLPLQDLKIYKELAHMLLLKKGQRLSIQPVTEKEFNFILKLGQKN